MWENIKKKITNLWTPLWTTFKEKGWGAPVIIVVIWQIIEWLCSGRKVPFSDVIFKSVQVWSATVVSAVWYLVLFKSYSKKLRGLDRLEKKLDKVETTGVEAVQAATGFIERAFGLQVLTEIRERFHNELLEALQALGFNLRNWENHITKKKEDKIVLTDDKSKIAVWLRYMRTYYFEEAFDIQRKEIVTNGRNLCFLLLATLQAFVDQLADGEILEYYAVTPVHPKDWYNWPHGRGDLFKPRAYFEENFIGLFYRTLREILKSPKIRDKIIHGRYILTADGVRKESQPFGWALDDFQTVQIQQEKTWLMPVAVPISKLKEVKCPVLKAFYTYYEWISERFPGDTTDRHIVPLFCCSWDRQGIEKWFSNKIDSEKDKATKKRDEKWKEEVLAAWQILCDNSSADAEELITLATDFQKKRLKDSLKQVKADYLRCKEAFEDLEKDVGQLLENKNQDIPKLIREVHYYDVLLSEHDERAKQENLKLLLQAALRLRDVQLIDNKFNDRWPSLREIFTRDLHSSPEMCWQVGLNEEQMDSWYTNGVKSEFSFFGLRDKSMVGDPDWKLIIATDLDYPFEVGKIRIIEPGDREWKAYQCIIESLQHQRNFKFLSTIKGTQG